MKKIKKIKNKTVLKKVNNKYPILISLCMGEIIKGLHVDFILTKKGKKYGSSVGLSMYNEPIALYDLVSADLTFWPMMECLAKMQTLSCKQNTKKTLTAKTNARS